jgi:photosystem II stability/assembly factor-like uncharacterized protein
MLLSRIYNQPMKSICFLLIAMLFATATFAQHWQFQNPFPALVSLNAVHFPDTLNGYIAGDYGTFMVTTEAGNNWTSIPTGTSTHLQAVWFSSPLNGILAGTDGIILKTINGGKDWITVA